MTWIVYADTWYLLFITWIRPVSAPLCQFNWLFYMFPDHSKCNKIWFEDASASGVIISHKLRNTPGSGCSPVAADHHHLLLLFSLLGPLLGPGPGLLAAVASEEAGGEDHAPHLQETRLHRGGVSGQWLLHHSSPHSWPGSPAADPHWEPRLSCQCDTLPLTRDNVHVTRDTWPLHLRLQPV